MSTPEQADTGGTVWDAPNQEVVGVGPPWTEGSGGQPGTQTEQQAGPDLDAMTKAQLLAYAGEHGVDVDEAWTKDDIKAEIKAAE
jgi:hypothetical protein